MSGGSFYLSKRERTAKAIYEAVLLRRRMRLYTWLSAGCRVLGLLLFWLGIAVAIMASARMGVLAAAAVCVLSFVVCLFLVILSSRLRMRRHVLAERLAEYDAFLRDLSAPGA